MLLNLSCLIFGGLLLALGYAIVALVISILIVTIPFGSASARIAVLPLAFGRTLVRRPDAGAGSLIGNVIWFVLASWWLALGHLVTGLLTGLTIIGIPLGLANFKLIPVSLTPFGRDIVDLEQARRLATPSRSRCQETSRDEPLTRDDDPRSLQAVRAAMRALSGIIRARRACTVDISPLSMPCR